MVRLDDIKLTNPIDGLKVDDVLEEHDSNNEEKDNEEDGFGRRDPFDYDYDDKDDGGRSQGKKTVSSDAQSTNVYVMKDFKVGEIVKSKAELILRARVQSVKANREFKVSHSDPKRFTVACVDKNCKWRLRGTLSASHCGWVIHSYEKHHRCSINLRQKVKLGAATAETIAHMIKNDENDTIRMQEMLESKYGMKVIYWKAWKGRQIGNHIVRGTPESSFLGLPSYLWLLEQANL
ncbi:hypothetical protein LIER_43263 [Lithospermum erythrorhizon]|uniref:Transposase MuDR plant domain-containing protein n=1 Tax=Lithospermum erythrorhizon TaxID=34254 RepID=A0AAV3PUZ7_LITER